MPYRVDDLRGVDLLVYETSVYGEYAVSGVSVASVALLERNEEPFGSWM